MSNSLQLSRVVSIKSSTFRGEKVDIRTLKVTTDDDEVFTIDLFYEVGEDDCVTIWSKE